MNCIVVLIAVFVLYLQRIFRLIFGYGRVFRIIKEIDNLNGGGKNANISFYIEERRGYGWRRIDNKEYNTKEVKFPTLHAAEQCLFGKYIRSNGVLTINGNVYKFVEYSYGY